MIRYSFLLTLLILLANCRDNDRMQTVTSDGIVQLTYWSAANPREIELASELVDQWNQENPQIQVQLQPLPASQSSEEVLLAAIAAGTTPDVCSNIQPGGIDDFILAGGLVRLDTFPDFWSFLEDRVPLDLLHSFQSPDGGYYQLPWKTNPIMILYNKTIFRKSGVEVPLLRYGDYLQAAEKIAVDHDGDGQVDYWMMYRDTKPIWWQRLFDFLSLYIAASGGQTLFRGAEIVFDSPAAVQVFEFLQEMYRQGYMPITQFQGDQFLAGRLATQITGPWMISYIENFKQPGFEYGVMPLPVPDDYEGPFYTYGDPKNISIFKTTRHPQEAWRFIKTLVSREADLRLLEICSQIPIRKDLIDDPLYRDYFSQNSLMVAFAEQAPYTRGADGVSDFKEIMDGISQEYEACVLYQRKSPAQAISDAARRARVIMEWNQAR